MSKMLRIDTCHPCTFSDIGPCNYCMHPDNGSTRTDGTRDIDDPAKIPDYCTLEDAPAWPTITSTDTERGQDDDAIIGPEYIAQHEEER